MSNYSFNVLDKPWIPVIDSNKKRIELSVKDLLLNAHQHERISDPMPLFEFGMYRFLQAFIMDAFEIRDQDHVADMLERGKFDTDVLTRYMNALHDRFDLFDEVHPFYQVPVQRNIPHTRGGVSVKPVSMLLQHVAKGNNTMHFSLTFETHHALSPKICTRALCAMQPFIFMYGVGYTNGINEFPPWYILVEGKNLFETLVLNACFTDIPLNNGSGNVSWKLDEYPTCGDVSSVSTLEGLTFLSRFVKLIPEKGGTCTYTGDPSNVVVRELVFERGLKLKGSWVDPNVSYVITKKRFPLVPRSLKRIWRNIGALMVIPHAGKVKSSWYERPMVISQFRTLQHDGDISKEKELKITAYGLEIDNAKVIEWQRERLGLPMNIIMSMNKGDHVQHALTFAEEVDKKVRFAIIKNDLDKSLHEQVQREFWDRIEHEFRGEYLSRIANANDDLDDLSDVLMIWKAHVKETAMRTLRDVIDPIALNVTIMERHVNAEKMLYYMLQNMEKKKKVV